MFKSAVTYKRITVTDAERTEKNAKRNVYPVVDGSRLGGDEGRLANYKERIKRTSDSYVQDK